MKFRNSYKLDSKSHNGTLLSALCVFFLVFFSTNIALRAQPNWMIDTSSIDISVSFDTITKESMASSQINFNSKSYLGVFENEICLGFQQLLSEQQYAISLNPIYANVKWLQFKYWDGEKNCEIDLVSVSSDNTNFQNKIMLSPKDTFLIRSILLPDLLDFAYLSPVCNNQLGIQPKQILDGIGSEFFSSTLQVQADNGALFFTPQDTGWHTIQVKSKICYANHQANIYVKSAVNEQEVNVNIIPATCSEKGKLLVSYRPALGASVLDSNTFILNDLIFNQELNSSGQVLANNGSIEWVDTIVLNEGVYRLDMKNNGGCIYKSNEEYLIERICNQPAPAFTPNGDGIDDSYYLDYNGTIHFHDKHGRLLMKKQGPIYWDGKDDAGNLLATGLYFINSGGMVLKLTIIR